MTVNGEPPHRDRFTPMDKGLAIEVENASELLDAVKRMMPKK